MVAPITKVTKVPVSNRLAYIHLNYEKQKPPFNLQLEMDNRYHLKKDIGPREDTLRADTSPTGDSYLSLLSIDKEVHSNRAYSKMISELPDAASFGATLTAERRETFGMMVGFVTTALIAAKQVKKLDLAGAASTLGVPLKEKTTVATKRRRIKRKGKTVRTIKYKFRHTVLTLPDGREVAKTAAGGWLLWSYGVAPLSGDIYTGLASLTSPFPWLRISGSSKQDANWQHYFEGQDGPVRNHYLTTVTGTYSIKQACDVRVENPNLWLANRLGFVNPIQWANEAIPFSFVVDWFSNLSNIIGSLTDFVGLEVTNPVVNQKLLVKHFQSYTNYRWEAVNPASGELVSKYTKRTRGLIKPVIKVAYERFQWQRGANAISLLVGFLPAIKPKR